MAGPDITPVVFRPSPNDLPLTIPTETLNIEEHNIPERLLQVYLRNYRNPTQGSANTLLEDSVVEDTVEEGEAEPINLSASFSSGLNMSYDYKISDLKDVVKNTPSYVKITKAPRNGQLVIKRLGQEIAVQEGDVVAANMLNEFMYS